LTLVAAAAAVVVVVVVVAVAVVVAMFFVFLFFSPFGGDVWRLYLWANFCCFWAGDVCVGSWVGRGFLSRPCSGRENQLLLSVWSVLKKDSLDRLSIRDGRGDRVRADAGGAAHQRLTTQQRKGGRRDRGNDDNVQMPAAAEAAAKQWGSGQKKKKKKKNVRVDARAETGATRVWGDGWTTSRANETGCACARRMLLPECCVGLV
jgi:hypothetical protein